MKRTPLRRKTTLKRGSSIARKPMRRGAKRSKYARRERDWDFMAWVKMQPCVVGRWGVPWPCKDTPCQGPIEADHMGDRGLSNKAGDDTCVPLCRGHHDERTRHLGTFWEATNSQLRAWRLGMIAETQRMYRERCLQA